MSMIGLRHDRSPSRGGAEYDAFLSYSHALDGRLVKALQSETEAFAKPWYRPRARRIFRDDANLAADPQLWSAIERALTTSRWFVLMASPASAASAWVARETAVDLRWIRNRDQVDAADPRFRDCVADIAATVSEVPKDSLIGDHVQRQRQTKRLVRTVITTLSILVLTAVAAGIVALVQRNAARTNQRIAVSRQLIAEAESVASSDPGTALRLGVAAQLISDRGETRASLVNTLTHTRYAKTLTGHHDRVQSVAFSPDGQTLAAGSSGLR
jgi:hypothetical protein